MRATKDLFHIPEQLSACRQVTDLNVEAIILLLLLQPEVVQSTAGSHAPSSLYVTALTLRAPLTLTGISLLLSLHTFPIPVLDDMLVGAFHQSCVIILCPLIPCVQQLRSSFFPIVHAF